MGNYKFKGDKIAFGYDKSQAKDFHKDLHEKLESKKQVTIWYDPLNIENSVLIKKISSPCISSFAFHCIFFLFPVIIFSMIGLGVFFEESYKDDIILTMFFLMGILFITAFIFGNISNIKMNRVIIEEIEKM